MKGSYIFGSLALLLATGITTCAQAQTGGYSVVKRGPDYKVLQKTVVENGTNRTVRYTELATGMNYTNSQGQLTEAQEQITLLPTGGQPPHRDATRFISLPTFTMACWKWSRQMAAI